MGTKCRSNYQPYPIYTTVLTGKNLPAHLVYRPRIPINVSDMFMNLPKPETPPGTMKEKLIQTMFRESEAQTDPYAVEVMDGVNKGLEILTLGWLSWKHGLPAGINEIRTIERARQKRAWEAALPIPKDKKSMEIRAILMEAMEINEWKYREELIAAIGSLRMELAEKISKEKSRENKMKYEERLNKYIKIKKEEKNKKLQKMKLNFNRQIRKLVFAEKKVNRKYHRLEIIRQFFDKTSELYAPLMRFGSDPKHWHEKISPECGFGKVFRRLEVLHQTIDDIPEPPKQNFDYVKKSKPRSNERDLCIRVTKWKEEYLEKLHEELRNIRKRRHYVPRPCYLKKKVDVQGVESEIPSVKGKLDEDEDLFQACLFLQKTVKGRAIQAVMFEGRVKCQELIEELKSTHALQTHMEDIKAEARKKIYDLQRQVEIDIIKEKRKNEILYALEGKTTGDMLDFLAKELLRLQDERATHALALLADQERHRREAAEAGRRQVEEQRRREHDEMFKQIMKVHQNTVQAYLEDILIENNSWLAHREAREYITETAKKIDQAAQHSSIVPVFTKPHECQEEEIISDLVHNFALPEVEKIMVRKRLNDKQRNYLKTCHDEVYSNIDKIVQGTRSQSGDLLPLPLVGKHKIPPVVRVKYLRLKRMHESSSSSLESKKSQESANSVLNEQFFQIPLSKTEVKQPFLPQQKENWSSGFSKQDVILENKEVDFDSSIN